MKYVIAVATVIGLPLCGFGQSFGDRCVGNWEGTMYLFNNGILSDSVPVTFEVASITDSSWTWLTEYHDEKRPMTKDYILRLSSAGNEIYVIDEQNGIDLIASHVDDRLYSVFQIGNAILTSTYEILDGQLKFEVMSGELTQDTTNVKNHPIRHVQKVALSRAR